MKRLLFDGEGNAQRTDHVHEGKAVFWAVDGEGDTSPSPWADLFEQIELRGGAVGFVARGPLQEAAADPAEVVRLTADLAEAKAKLRREAVGIQGWREEVQRIRVELAAAQAEAQFAGGVLAALPAGSALLPEAREGHLPAILRGLAGVPGLTWAAFMWLGGSLIPWNDWWAEGWHLSLVIGAGFIIANVYAAHLRACGVARGQWRPVVREGRYVTRVDRLGGVEVWCRSGDETGWRPVESFVALPPTAPAGE